MSGPFRQTQYNATADESPERQMAEMWDLAAWMTRNMQKIADGEVPAFEMRAFAKRALYGGRSIYQRDLTNKRLDHG